MQLAPPGSTCAIAIAIGVRVVDTAPGSIQGLHLVVDDIHAVDPLGIRGEDLQVENSL